MIEREFYRLADVAARFGCTVDDLVHLGIQDKTQICVNIYGASRNVARERVETEAGEYDPEYEPISEDERREEAAHNAAHARWLSRTSKAMPPGVYELTRDDLRSIERLRAGKFELHECLKFDGARWWLCEFDRPVSIGPDDLCVLHEEVERIGREVFGQTASATTSTMAAIQAERDALRREVAELRAELAALKAADPELTGKSKTTALRLIGGMAWYGWKIDPRARLDRIGELLRDLGGERAGVSERALRDLLKAAGNEFDPPPP